MLTCDHNQLSCTVPHGQQWLVANSQAFISISGKKKRILFIRVLQITSKQTTIYGTYLSAWQFFVWTGFDFHPHPRPPPPPRQPSRMKIVNTSIKWLAKEILIVLVWLHLARHRVPERDTCYWLISISRFSRLYDPPRVLSVPRRFCG